MMRMPIMSQDAKKLQLGVFYAAKDALWAKLDHNIAIPFEEVIQLHHEVKLLLSDADPRKAHAPTSITRKIHISIEWQVYEDLLKNISEKMDKNIEKDKDRVRMARADKEKERKRTSCTIAEAERPVKRSRMFKKNSPAAIPEETARKLDVQLDEEDMRWDD
eukprot:ANDGO_03877.mRNA.1 hypothetical protein